MKILLDHCVDWRLKHLLPSHEVTSAREMGWDELKNGRLLAAAATESFQAIITVDQHLRDQQNLVYLPIAVVVLIAHSNRSADLRPLMRFVERAIPSLKAGQLIDIDASGTVQIIAPPQ